MPAPVASEPIPELDTKFDRGLVRLLLHPRLPWWLALTALALSSSCLWFGFYLDDYVGRYIYSDLPGADRLFELYEGGYGLANGVPADNHWQIEEGWAPWWTYEKLLIRLFRPLGIASHWLDFTLWPDQPWAMHVHSLLWLALLVLACTRMYRAALGTVVGGLAALLFAIDHTHGFVVGYIANRHALITALLGVLCLDAHLRARMQQSPRKLIAAYALYVAALVSGESTVAILGYLFAHALCIERTSLRRRALVVAPYLVITLIWRALYTRAGYGAVGSGLYIDPGREPVAYALALLERAPVLVLGQFLAPPAELYSVFPRVWAHAMLVLAVVFSVALCLALWPLLRRERSAWFWLLGALVALVPAASTYPHNRQLLFTSFGAMGLLAQLWNFHVVELRGQARTKLLRVSREVGGLVFFAHSVVSPLVMPITTNGIAVTGPLLQAPASVGDDVAGKDAVFVTAPDYFAVKLVQLFRRLEQKPLPRHFRALSFGPEHVTVTRTSERTLELQYAEGILSTAFMELYRDRHIPMRQGERVVLEGLTIEVLALTDDLRARQVRFTFDAGLEQARYRFYYWNEGRFERYTPPALGSSHHLPPAKLDLHF